MVPVDHLMPGPVAAAYFYEELYGTVEDDKSPKDDPKVSFTTTRDFLTLALELPHIQCIAMFVRSPL